MMAKSLARWVPYPVLGRVPRKNLTYISWICTCSVLIALLQYNVRIMEFELKPINTEEELLSFTKLRGQVFISKFRNSGPFAKEENYTGLWKVLDRDVRQGISLGENEEQLRLKWSTIKDGLMENWIDQFKEAHGRSRDEPGPLR